MESLSVTLLSATPTTLPAKLPPKEYAHEITPPDKFKLRPQKKRLSSLRIATGRLCVRIIHLPKDKELPLHIHSKRIDKFLLTGKLQYDDDQEFRPGCHAKLKPHAPYKVKALEASNLLLVERDGSATTDASHLQTPISRVLEDWFQRARSVGLELGKFIRRAGIPASIISVLVIASGVLFWRYPTADEKEFATAMRDIAVSLVSALIFLGFVSYAQRIYQTRLPKVLDGFDLDEFCENISDAKNIVRIYSTYSNLFLRHELLNTFEKNAMFGIRKSRPRKMEILLHDPFSAGISQRDSERTDVNVINLVVQNLFNLEAWIANNESRREYIEVRIANSLPRHQHHQIDDEVSFSFYPRNYPASESRCISCSASSALGQFAVESFREIWDDYTFTVTLKVYLERNRARCEAVTNNAAQAP